MTFCKGIEELYGTDRVTLNMHLHMHILDCILDFGPVYAFWLFSFERFNGVLGEYSTNQRSVEIQIMRKFLAEQHVKALPRPSAFADLFEPVLQKMASCSSGTLRMITSNSSSSLVISQSLLSIGPVRKGLFWSISHQESLITCHTPIYKHSLACSSLPNLKLSYQAILDNINTTTVTIHCEIISAINFAGEMIGTCHSRHKRSAYILAAWCGVRGRLDSTGTNLRPGVVQNFIRQNVEVDGKYHTFIMAEVKWLHPHASRRKLGAPVEIWCRTFYEPEGPADFIPLQRIHSRFVPAFQVISNENVLVVCPMSRKLQC